MWASPGEEVDRPGPATPVSQAAGSCQLAGGSAESPAERRRLRHRPPRGRRRCAARLTRAALLQEGCRRRSYPKGSRCRSASCVIADKPVVRCHLSLRLRSQEGDLRQVLNKNLCTRSRYARHMLICPHTRRDPPRSRAAAAGPLSLKQTVEDQVVAEAVRRRTLLLRTGGVSRGL